MANKIKTITLTSGWTTREENKDYRVEKVTDSLEFTPGKLLGKKEVQDLCDAKDWKVTVQSYKG